MHGAYPLLAVVERARQNGCQAIAITDHADGKLRAATPEYFAQIREARQRFSDMVVIAGVEWNVPPYAGREHATLLVAERDEELLAEFKRRFDDYGRDDGEVLDAEAAQRWLAAQATARPVILLNHPSRKRERGESIRDDFLRWRRAGDSLIGFSGAPGHQRQVPLGAYAGPLQLIDRWDPAAAIVGGAWDQLLADGFLVWGAIAPSDFHSDRGGDFWPGEFSETWVYAAERSVDGILDALRAGSFFACHGGIARQVELLVDSDGLDRPARPGEIIEVDGGTIDVRLQLRVPDQDLQGTANRIDQIELVGIQGQTARVLATTPWGGGQRVELLKNFVVPDGGLVVRARGRRVVSDGPDLMFYTNPVQVQGR